MRTYEVTYRVGRSDYQAVRGKFASKEDARLHVAKSLSDEGMKDAYIAAVKVYSPNSQFQHGFGRQGGGCYKCVECGKQTRETGQGESALGYCAYCFEVSGWENTVSDNGFSAEMRTEGLLALRAKYHRA
jgi:cytochrome c553